MDLWWHIFLPVKESLHWHVRDEGWMCSDPRCCQQNYFWHIYLKPAKSLPAWWQYYSNMIAFRGKNSVTTLIFVFNSYVNTVQWEKDTADIIEPKNYRIIDWLGLESTPRITKLQSPCHKQGYQPLYLILDQASYLASNYSEGIACQKLVWLKGCCAKTNFILKHLALHCPLSFVIVHSIDTTRNGLSELLWIRVDLFNVNPHAVYSINA